MEANRLNVVFNVRDFAISTEFYESKLGLRRLSSWNTPEGPGVILEAGPGRTVELFGPPYGARSDKRPIAGAELAFEVDGVDGWHDRLAAAGVPIARGLVDNPWGDRSFGIDDPDGVRIWILEVTDGGG